MKAVNALIADDRSRQQSFLQKRHQKSSLLKSSDLNLIVLKASDEVSQVEIEYTIIFIFLN